MDKLNIIYIIGYPRSGTTFLGNVLGQADGAFHAGEIMDMWKETNTFNSNWYRTGENRYKIKTGEDPWRQGALFHEDTVWGTVWQDVLEKRGLANHDPLVVHRKFQDARAQAMSSLMGSVSPSNLKSLAHEDWDGKEYSALIGELYRGLARVSGASVVIDSSKNVETAWIAAKIEGVDITYVHIVRDPRGVIYSRQKRLRDGNKYKWSKLRFLHTLKDAWGWRRELKKARGFLNMHGQEYVSLNYEEFVRGPRHILQEVLSRVGLSAESIPFRDEYTIELKENHAIGGNRNKFKTGTASFREDMKWKNGFHRIEAALIGVIAKI